MIRLDIDGSIVNGFGGHLSYSEAVELVRRYNVHDRLICALEQALGAVLSVEAAKLIHEVLEEAKK